MLPEGVQPRLAALTMIQAGRSTVEVSIIADDIFPYSAYTGCLLWAIWSPRVTAS